MSLAKLSKNIDELEPIKGFNPARFTLIESMYRRLQNAHHQANDVLIQRTQQQVDEYKLDAKQSLTEANATLASIQTDLPKHSEQATALLNKGEFQQLENMLIQGVRDNKRQAPLSELSSLKNEMSHIEVIEQDSEAVQPLDDMLFDQEQDARRASGSSLLPSASSEVQFELQSMKRFRESMKYFNIDKIIARAINDFPENAGPHNPHMLAITSLMRMNELSPQYVRRFASYIETVLWLEKNSSKLNRKKAP